MNTPIVKAQMLIRRPVADVFNAFIDPTITTKFWFTKSSGKLCPDARVRWDWEMYDVHDEIAVKAFEPNERVVFEWSAPKTNTVEWRFEPHAQGTMMFITNSDLKGDDPVAEALALTEGWNLVLAAAKAWLEQGVNINVVADHAPDKNVGGSRGAL
jgi:uncharacterized protein YndB with AHSA1/START domain